LIYEFLDWFHLSIAMDVSLTPSLQTNPSFQYAHMASARGAVDLGSLFWIKVCPFCKASVPILCLRKKYMCIIKIEIKILLLHLKTF